MELPQNVTVELGRSALLACRVMGRPAPTVTWHRGDGQPLEAEQGSKTGQPHSGVLFFESKRLGLGKVGRGDGSLPTPSAPRLGGWEQDPDP